MDLAGERDVHDCQEYHEVSQLYFLLAYHLSVFFILICIVV